MSINFRRNRTQVEYESLVGISSFEDLQSMKEEFKNYTLTSCDVPNLKTECKADALDYLYNGLVSLAEGLSNMVYSRYTWATVKIYYAVFYFLRASMASNCFAILQNRSMYRLKIAAGEKPYSSNNKKYRSTHSGTIAHYKDVFSGVDRLLTNRIDDLDPYEWLEEVRNIANYREVGFLDPECLEVWTVFDDAIKDGTIDSLINLFINDDEYVYCFQEEYAVVAIGIKRLQETLIDFNNNNLLEAIEVEKLRYVDAIIPDAICSLNIEQYIHNIIFNC